MQLLPIPESSEKKKDLKTKYFIQALKALRIRPINKCLSVRVCTSTERQM